MTFTVGVLVGTLVGVVVTLAAMKLGDWLAWCAISRHLEDALAAREDGRPIETAEGRALDAMDVYLEALDRQQRARRTRPDHH